MAVENPLDSTMQDTPSTEYFRAASPHGGSALGSSQSLPDTLVSIRISEPCMYACSRNEIQTAIDAGSELLSFSPVECPHEAVILQAIVDLMYDHALGGALVCAADTEALKSIFAVDRDAHGLEGRGGNRPALRSCDDGYMTRRLR